MTTFLSIVFVFGILILVHEAGHFFVARKAGIKVLEFSFGIGPKIIGKQGKETLYSLRLLPLGGFVRFLSEEELKEDDPVTRQELLSRSFESKSIWKKMAVIVAGAFMNFVLGAVLFIIIYAWFGVPTASDANVIGTVIPDRPAAAQGLQPGDRVLSINGISTPDWTTLTKEIHKHPGEKINVTIEKAQTNEILMVDITPQHDQQSGRGLIGISPQVNNERVSVIKAAQLGLQQTAEFTKMILVLLAQMITGAAPVELSGPIGVVQVIGEGASQGISTLLGLTAILSIQFGILNLLPLPALDGGQLAVLTYEGIRRKPLAAEKKGLIQLTGFALLMALMIAVTYQDIIRLLAK